MILKKNVQSKFSMQIYQSHITLPKIFKPVRYWVNAQLGIVLINPKKFHQNLTWGFEEMAWTKISMAIFQSPITPPKIREPGQD